MTAEMLGAALSGNTIIAVTWMFAAVTTLALALRIWARLLSGAWGVDDWLMLVAWALYFAQCAATPSTHVGMHHSTDPSAAGLTDAQYQEGKMWHFIIGTLYTTTTTLSKCSISCFMLRIARDKIHRWIFQGVIGLSIIACATRLVHWFSRCKHIQDNWYVGQDPPACASSAVMTNITIFFSVICISTDLVCSILPVIIVYNLRMKKKLKVYVIIMFIIGTAASVATMLRVPFLFTYQVKQDFLAHLAPLAFYSNLEGAVAIVVACISTLRPLAKFLPCVGSRSPNRQNNVGPYNAIGLDQVRSRSENQSAPQETPERIDDTDDTVPTDPVGSQSHILRQSSPANTTSDDGNTVHQYQREFGEEYEVIELNFV